MTKRMAVLALPICVTVLGVALSACASPTPQTKITRLFEAAVSLAENGDLSDHRSVETALGVRLIPEEIRNSDIRYCGSPGVTQDAQAVRFRVEDEEGSLGIRTAPYGGSTTPHDSSYPVIQYVLQMERNCLPEIRVNSIRSARILISWIDSIGCIRPTQVENRIPNAKFTAFRARGVSPNYTYEGASRRGHPGNYLEVRMTSGEMPDTERCVNSIIINNVGES